MHKSAKIGETNQLSKRFFAIISEKALSKTPTLANTRLNRNANRPIANSFGFISRLDISFFVCYIYGCLENIVSLVD